MLSGDRFDDRFTQELQLLTGSMKQLKMVQERFLESKDSLQQMTPENKGNREGEVFIPFKARPQCGRGTQWAMNQWYIIFIVFRKSNSGSSDFICILSTLLVGTGSSGYILGYL